jgi:hypothetical protein
LIIPVGREVGELDGRNKQPEISTGCHLSSLSLKVKKEVKKDKPC